MEDPTTQMGAAPALFVGVRAMGLDGLILVARSAVIGIAVASGNRPAPREAPRSDLRGLAVTYLPRLALPHGRVLPRPAASGAGWCWGVVAGAALTIDPPQTNRLVMTPPLCVFAAIGLVAVARLAWRSMRVGSVAVASIALMATVGVTTRSLHDSFHDPTQPERYSDPNTEVVNRMAYEARALGPDLTVHFSGPTRMWYGGFANILIIAPDAEGIDVEATWGPDSPRPALDGPTLFVLLPERRAELDVVRAWFPGGAVTEHATEEGEPQFTAYRVDA